MGRRLYVFVDESGNHSVRDCYSVAACWCVSEYEDPTEVLKPTTRRLKADLVDDEGSELKGESLPDRVLEDFFVYLRRIASDDGSLDLYNLPWDNGFPIGFSIYDSDSELSKLLSEEFLGETRSGTTPQLVALSSIVSPLLRVEGPDHAPLSSRHVLLDATTWERPRYKVHTFLDRLDWPPEIYLETRQSHAIPGIQLADVAAYLRRQNVLEGSCNYRGLRELLV